MLESYVRTAKRIKDLSEMAFFTEFGETQLRRNTSEGLWMSLLHDLDLHKRYATEVWDVINEGLKDHEELTGESLRQLSAHLVIPESYKRSAESEEPQSFPSWYLMKSGKRKGTRLCWQELLVGPDLKDR
jgi:hypothetical protein